MPRLIVSDQGRELVSKGIKSLCFKLGIRKVQTSGYNPTGNASIERFHRFLMASVSILFNQLSIEWDELVEPVLFAYRVSVNDVTGFSPFSLKRRDWVFRKRRDWVLPNPPLGVLGEKF